MDGYYLEGVFEIENVGDYSDLVSTKFGIHIIRLDGVKEEHFKPYEEVKGEIEQALVQDYQRLAVKEYRSRFNMSEDVLINKQVIDEILASP